MMNRSLFPIPLVIIALSAAPLVGCVVSQDGNTTTIETATRYEGTEERVTVEHSAGQSIRIVSDNGDVEVRTGTGSDIEVTFAPFVLGRKNEGDRAVAQMEDYLELTALTGDTARIEVARKDGASGGLGADITVVLPAGFDGAFEVLQDNGGTDVDLGSAQVRSTKVTSDNGSIDIVGARGKLDVFTDNGSISVGVAAWSADDGSVKTGNGDIDVTVPADVNGTMTAQAAGELTEEGIPSSWATAGEGSSKSYTMGDGKGGRVDLVTDGLGDITITAK